jgi:hypothetical protein
MKNCLKCNEAINNRVMSGYCRECFWEEKRISKKQIKKCTKCDKKLGHANLTGYCLSCNPTLFTSCIDCNSPVSNSSKNGRCEKCKNAFRKSQIVFRFCKICDNKIKNKKAKYDYCWDCYCKSSERKAIAKDVVIKRGDISGPKSPSWRGGPPSFTCICGIIFNRHIHGGQIPKYCSKECKYKYTITISKTYTYKENKMRSSWELAFAQYLDSIGYRWIHEPEAFKTSVGFYTPDFWVEQLQSYVEVKGFFRKDAKQKFEEFSKSHPIILADKKYLLNLGFTMIKSGPRKGQLCPPALQP